MKMQFSGSTNFSQGKQFLHLTSPVWQQNVFLQHGIVGKAMLCFMVLLSERSHLLLGMAGVVREIGITHGKNPSTPFACGPKS